MNKSRLNPSLLALSLSLPFAALACFTVDDVVGDGETDPTSEGDGDPTTGDGDPTTGDGDPTTGDGDPTTGDGDPTTGDGDPTDGDCDPWLQDCGEGEKCVPYASEGTTPDANKCVPILGDGAAGDECVFDGFDAATDSCNHTTLCWESMAHDDGTWYGVCTEFCQGTADGPQCPPGTSCAIIGNASVTLCIQTCDPLLQDCGSGLACYWVTDSFNCMPSVEGIPPGEPCDADFLDGCMPGTMCVAGDVVPFCSDSSCCASFCDLTEPWCEESPFGAECVSFFEEGTAPPGYEDTGICILPS